MARNSNYDYFKAFARMVDYSCEEAKFLRDTIANYNPGEIERKIKEIHKIEHAADLDKHEMMSNLAKEFITPIDREDIMNLAQDLDNVTDEVEDVMLRLYMFNITSIRAEAVEFANLVVKCCEALKKVAEEFKFFRKSNSINNYIVEVNKLEDEGDRLYAEAMRRLFSECSDTLEIMKWRETFSRFENCCDACEHVCDTIEWAILKNS
ncbi:MAG: DUF47 family protein [Oscillospiraceae bacterium]|nr:DUF47 family protein [Oscillospiraceae bacterium]